MWVLLIHVVNTGECYAFGFNTQRAAEDAMAFYGENPHVVMKIVFDAQTQVAQ